MRQRRGEWREEDRRGVTEELGMRQREEGERAAGAGVWGKTGGKGAGTIKGRRQTGQGKGREKKDGEQRKVFV